MIPWRMLAQFQSSQNCIWLLNFFILLSFSLSVKMIPIHSQIFERYRNCKGKKNNHHPI